MWKAVQYQSRSKIYFILFLTPTTEYGNLRTIMLNANRQSRNVTALNGLTTTPPAFSDSRLLTPPAGFLDPRGARYNTPPKTSFRRAPHPFWGRTMKTVYKYIKFEQSSSKVVLWGCLNRKSNDILGCATYYPAWRQWVMDFKEGCVFNNSCLDDISDFLNQLNLLKKEELWT